MAQSSWPRTIGTTVQRQFTDVQWGDLFGRDSGILEDYDGTSYALSLSSTTDVVTVGSATQDSLATVSGFGHMIPKGAPEQLTIPPAAGGAQTTIIGLRYDTTSTDPAGPVRLVTYPSPGSADGVPTASSLPLGTVVLPLWSVTRQPAQVLSTAVVRSLRRWLGSTLFADTVPPNSAPIGTIVRLPGQKTYHRQLSTGGIVGPVWVDPTPKTEFDPPKTISQFWGNLAFASGQFFDIGSIDVTQGSRVTVETVSAVSLPAGSQLLVESTWNSNVVGAPVGTLGPNGASFTTEVRTAFVTFLNPGKHTFGVKLTALGTPGSMIRQSALITPTP